MRQTIFAAGLVVAASSAAEADGRFQFRSETQIAQSDPFAPDDELLTGAAAPFGLETGLDSNNWLRRVEPLGGGVLRLEGQVRARTYFDRDELNSLLFTPRAQYWTSFADNKVQLRLSAAFSHLRRDGEAHWSRPEGEAQVRWRPDGTRRAETVLRVRVNAYDFDAPALNGLDSERVRIGVEQYVRAADDKAELRLSVFHETADADEDRFSFEELRARAELSWAVDDKTRAAVLADYRDRDYDGPFSGLIPQARADQRFLAEARIERQLAERVTAVAAGGYLDNQSNIAARDYGGGVFRLGVRIDF